MVEIRRMFFSFTPIELASVSAFDFASADAFSMASLRAARSSFNVKLTWLSRAAPAFIAASTTGPSSSSFVVSAETVTCAS